MSVGLVNPVSGLVFAEEALTMIRRCDCGVLGSTGCQPVVSGSLPETNERSSGGKEKTCRQTKRWSRETPATDGLTARATQILAAIILVLTSHLTAATLQERIDSAAPNETIALESGTYTGPIVI